MFFLLSVPDKHTYPHDQIMVLNFKGMRLDSEVWKFDPTWEFCMTLTRNELRIATCVRSALP